MARETLSEDDWAAVCGRLRRFIQGLPPDLSRNAQLALIVFRLHSRLDGSGISADLKSLCDLTQTDRRSFLRHAAELKRAGLLVDDGWEVHNSFVRTRRRRLNFKSLRRMEGTI